MSGALLNLVRVDRLEDSEGLDHSTWTATYDHRDDVDLVTPGGEPAAMLASSSWVDNDVRYEYISGGVGASHRRARHQIALAIDYLDNKTRSKLERWQRDRALVQFNPGYGRQSMLAYRPLPGAGLYYADGTSPLLDLTGLLWLGLAGDSTNTLVWDADSAVMRGPYAGSVPRRVIPTAFGAAQVFESAKTNRHRPGFPVNATEGHGLTDAGWTKTGANSTDITFALANSGSMAFGHNDCYSSLHVTTTRATSRDRVVDASSQWNSSSGEHHYSFSGTSWIGVSVWLRGRFSSGAEISFGKDGGNTETVSLGGLDLGQWTRISLSAFNTWTDDPFLKIDLSTSGLDDDDFYIGPTMVTSGVQRSPEWAPYGSAVMSGAIRETGFTFPPAGSMVASFYLPAGADYAYTSLIEYDNVTSGRLGFNTTGQALFVPATGVGITGSVSLREGEINTLTATWGSGETVRLYCNGAYVNGATTAVGIADTSGTLRIGGGSICACWPLAFLSCRIDANVYTASEVAVIDASLRDPVANMVSVQARGRSYRIVQLPSTPRNQAGGAHWIGNLVLEEWEYDSNLADITTAEVI